ncbi:MAG: hypothetical protein K2X73_06405 [Sphingomonas sp.]|uniref:hypothetical protein n=1 Tax=Sphingomonas sp. TaxID=28214 RepID=UPI0025E10940|nr:hypothetical protein [Sphingomonas sp.]MBX9881590.1 hypothetical protein [Sphingomonas sp.]
MIAALGAMLLFLLWHYPHVPAIAALHRFTVRPIAALLNRLDRRQLIFYVLALAFVLLAGEWLVMAGPLDLALLMAWDVSLYVDAVLGAALVASVTRVMPLLRFAGRLRPRPRARRPRRARPAANPGANDDDHPAHLLIAV